MQMFTPSQYVNFLMQYLFVMIIVGIMGYFIYLEKTPSDHFAEDSKNGNRFKINSKCVGILSVNIYFCHLFVIRI